MAPAKTRRCVLGLAVVVLVGCGGGSSAFRDARKAELRKDYDTALVDYQKALETRPDDAHYIIHERQARIEAAIFHVKQGKRLLEGGRQEDAAGEFQKAASIDPSNETARQELARIVAAQAAAKRAREKALQEAMKPEQASLTPVVKLKPFPSEPIAHIRIGPADSKKVFETLAKLGDMNVAFTKDFTPGSISLDLSNVKLDEALRILTYQTKTFWMPITPNTILIIPDNAANHREFDEQVVRTVYLTNPLAPADRTQISNTLKQLLNIQKIVDNPDNNAIIISDTPQKVAAAESLIHNLDHGKAEVLVDVAIVEADADRIRDLGISPTSLSASGAPEGTLAGIGFNPVTSSGTATLPAVTLNNLKNLTGNDFSIALPGAVAAALLNDSHTRILQNPEVRVTDGQSAELKVGTKVPFATGSFLPSYGGAVSGGTSGGTSGIGLLASTQFQYQEVGVDVKLTPRVMADGQVSLHALIDISSVGAPVTIGGLSQPTFGQRHVEQDIRLREGEVSLLGGLLQSTDSTSVSGLPFLGQLPLLRYLFSTEHRERVETEILVMLTPHVIRLPETLEGSKDLRVGSGGQSPGGGEAVPPESFPQAPGVPQ